MKRFIFFLYCLITLSSHAQKTENLVIVTLDGLRWQEVFGGVDDMLMNDSLFNQDTDGMKEKFWSPSAGKKGKNFFHFYGKWWQTQGQLYGNRNYDNKMDNANPYWFSYPGLQRNLYRLSRYSR